MPNLYLLRHGHAHSGSPDAARLLTDHGAADVERLAAWAARAGLAVAEIRHSDRRRTEQTAAILARHLHPRRGTRAIAGIGPNDDPAALAGSLPSETDPVMIVSHLPFLSSLVSALLGTDRPVIYFHEATLVGLTRDDERWAVDFVVYPAVI